MIGGDVRGAGTAWYGDTRDAKERKEEERRNERRKLEMARNEMLFARRRRGLKKTGILIVCGD